MLKRSTIWLLIIVILITGCLGCKSAIVNEFELADYQWAVRQFPSTRKVNQIANAQNAIDIAKIIWAEYFGSGIADDFKSRPIKVYYDSLNGCWLIEGTLPNLSNVVGEVPHVIISRSGEVLAVWGD